MGKDIHLGTEARGYIGFAGGADMRKPISGLSDIADIRCGFDFFEESLCIFCNKGRNRVKNTGVGRMRF